MFTRKLLLKITCCTVWNFLTFFPISLEEAIHEEYVQSISRNTEDALNAFNTYSLYLLTDVFKTQSFFHYFH